FGAAAAAFVWFEGIAVPAPGAALAHGQQLVDLDPVALPFGGFDLHVVAMAVLYRPVDQLPGPVLQGLDRTLYVTGSACRRPVDEVVEWALLDSQSERALPGLGDGLQQDRAAVRVLLQHQDR